MSEWSTDYSGAPAYVPVHDDAAVCVCVYEYEYGEKTGVANVSFRNGTENVAIRMP